MKVSLDHIYGRMCTVPLEDWTPDKGFNKKIFIKSNGNPDFVVSDSETCNTVSIECKFRSRFYKIKNNEADYISIGDEMIFNRYRKYQTETNIFVFLLLGAGGLAEQPENLYLLTLDEISTIREKENYDFGGIRIKRKILERYKIREFDLIDYLFRV